MKIQRFNESLSGRYKPTDKILKGTLHIDFEINREDIEWNINEYGSVENALTAYLQDTISNKFIDYELVDYQGNKIEDEELFDETNKYNL